MASHVGQPGGLYGGPLAAVDHLGHDAEDDVGQPGLEHVCPLVHAADNLHGHGQEADLYAENAGGQSGPQAADYLPVHGHAPELVAEEVVKQADEDHVAYAYWAG